MTKNLFLYRVAFSYLRRDPKDVLAEQDMHEVKTHANVIAASMEDAIQKSQSHLDNSQDLMRYPDKFLKPKSVEKIAAIDFL